MERREFQLKYKGDRCVHCGKSVAETVKRYGTFHRLFQFNHIDPREKDPDYDNLIRQNVTSKQLDELDKCILLCANCHAIVHAQNVNGILRLTIKVAHRIAVQRFKGQFIVDAVDKKLSFFTADELLIEPYWLAVGSEPPRLVFGHELRQHLTSHLRRTKQDKCLSIARDTGKLVYAVNRVDEQVFQVQQHCSFAIVPVTIKQLPLMIWLRNGVAVVRTGPTMMLHKNSLCTAQYFYDQLDRCTQNGDPLIGRNPSLAEVP